MPRHPETKYDKATAAVGREIGMRRRLYPKWVAGGRMKQAEASEQIRDMEEAYKILRELQEEAREANKAQPDLL